MKLRRRAMFFGIAAAASAQNPLDRDRDNDPLRPRDIKLPSGKSQKDEILKADRERNIEDARVLATLTAELRDDIEKNDRFVLSIATLKKLDEVEKLAKKIRGRMKRY
jgi:hypothetical protein